MNPEDEDDENQLIQQDPDGNKLNNIYFFFGCGERTNRQLREFLSDMKSTIVSPPEKLMKFFGSDVMSEYGVRF